MFKTNPLSVKEIEKIALEIRKEYKIKLNKYFPILEIIEKLVDKNLLAYQILENDDKMFDENMLAIYVPTENIIYVKDSVIEEYENGVYRAAFTLAHEFFHYLQAKKFNFSFTEVDDCKPFENVEWQADEFAGQLLIPTKYIDLDENVLVKKFHVSIECALTRKLKHKKRKLKEKGLIKYND